MYTVNNPAINERMILDMVNNRDKEYSNRMLLQLIYIINNSNYPNNEYIEDCFTLLRIGISFNTPSNHFYIINLINHIKTFLENNKMTVLDIDEFKSVNCAKIITLIDNMMLSNSDNSTVLYNLKEYKHTIIKYFLNNTLA